MKICENCGATFKVKQKDRPNRFCSRTCYAAKRPRRKETTKGTRMRKIFDHPLSTPSGGITEARLVLYEKIGPGSHPCTWCKETVTWMPGRGLVAGALIADHLDWNHHNNDPDNLVPSCNACNSHRIRNGGRARIQPDEFYITSSDGTRSRAAQRYCVICGTQFLALLSQVRNGKGFYCSRSCARRAPKKESPSSPSA